MGIVNGKQVQPGRNPQTCIEILSRFIKINEAGLEKKNFKSMLNHRQTGNLNP